MSRRYRKRRNERLLNSEFIAESAPRGLTHPLPHNPEVRVRPVYDTKPLDRRLFEGESLTPEQFRDLRRIDNGKIVQDLRRLHIETDLRNKNIDPTGQRYLYKQVKIGRAEQVYLPREHPVCVEREERRKVLFAKNKAGKGGSQKPPLLPQLTVKCVRR